MIKSTYQVGLPLGIAVGRHDDLTQKVEAYSWLAGAAASPGANSFVMANAFDVHPKR